MDTPPFETLPVVPGRQSVLFPGSSVPVRIGRLRSKVAPERALERGRELVFLAQKDAGGDEDPAVENLHRVGTLCKIEKVSGNAESGYQVLLRGLRRVQVTEFSEKETYLEARVLPAHDDLDVDEKTAQALLGAVKGLARDILALIPADTRQLENLVDAIDDLVLLASLCADNLPLTVEKKQELLSTLSVKSRVLVLLQSLQEQKETLELQGEIREKLNSKLGKQQREHILREQMKAIREELGEGQDSGKGSEDYLRRIAEANLPEEARKVAVGEAKRLESVGNSPEAGVIRNYLDLLCALPWDKSSQDALDLDAARQVLDADHHGLEKVKKRILQHLAVMKLKSGGKGSILLLVGPPGVGKTSLAQSVAKALSREFVRASLGGVRDDAEIRGHRRTYIGAIPGRIIQGLKRAGVNNPVFLLDEIDKLGRGYGGDPASALLEVLDPEQNGTFSDHYLEVPFDLSKVFFVATANSLEGIPGPLLDRMEVIELSGYTTAEKLHIAKTHLVPKQLVEHGLSPKQLTLGDDALLRVITHYTREAGVRELQRHIAALCRGSTEAVLKRAPDALPVRITDAELEEHLGQERYVSEVAERLAPPGVVTGLAWTPRGGEILFIESSHMPGTGRLILTGQLGEVMKESAQIALSLVRAHLSSLVPHLDLEKRDLHIHVPAGAIPKDGPSAGVTMLTTIASLFLGRSVSPKLAMTGEITLRGAVTPVGGIKEKVLAAHRAGIERILLARRNERDLKDVPEEVRAALTFEFVDSVADVLKKALDIEVPTLTPRDATLGNSGPAAPHLA